MKDFYGSRLLNRCGWRTDYSLWGCYLARGHEAPHRAPSDPRLPTNLTRAEQEEWERQMRPLSVAVTNKPNI